MFSLSLKIIFEHLLFQQKHQKHQHQHHQQSSRKLSSMLCSLFLLLLQSWQRSYSTQLYTQTNNLASSHLLLRVSSFPLFISITSVSFASTVAYCEQFLPSKVQVYICFCDFLFFTSCSLHSFSRRKATSTRLKLVLRGVLASYDCFKQYLKCVNFAVIASTLTSAVDLSGAFFSLFGLQLMKQFVR